MLLYCLLLSEQVCLSSYMEAQMPMPQFLSQKVFPLLHCLPPTHAINMLHSYSSHN